MDLGLNKNVSSYLDTNPIFGGSGSLPEQASAENLYADASQVASPPPAPGLGLAGPAALPAPSQDASPVVPPLTPAPPAAPAAPAPAGAPEKPLIDFKTNPLGAIGLVLSAAAAGLRGDPSPVAQLHTQRLQEQAMAYKQADFGLQATEAFAKAIKDIDPSEIPVVAGEFQKNYGGTGVNFVQLGEAVKSGALKDASATLSSIQAAGFNPETLATTHNADGSLNIQNIKKLGALADELQKIKLQHADDAVNAGKEEAARKAADNAAEATAPETFKDQAQAGVFQGKPALIQVGSNGTVRPLRDPAGGIVQPPPKDEAPHKFYDDPVKIEVDDGQGGVKQVMAQQNIQSGLWVTADEKRSPIDTSKGFNIVKETATGGGRVAGQVARVLGAATLANKEVRNMLQTTAGATAGVFSDASLLGTVKGALARSLTPEQDKSLRVTAVGVQRALAGIESMGLAPPGSLTNQFNGLIPQAGESKLLALQKFGSIRQVVESGLETLEQSPLVTDKQIKQIQGLREDIAKAIPWTPSDIITMMNSKNPNATVADFASKVGAGKSDVIKPGKGAAAPADATETKTIGGITYHKVGGQWMQ